MTTDIDLDHLQEYLDGELDESGRSELEERLRNEPDLADAMVRIARELAVISSWSRERGASSRSSGRHRAGIVKLPTVAIAVAAAAAVLLIGLAWRGSRPGAVGSPTRDARQTVTGPESVRPSETSPAPRPTAPADETVAADAKPRPDVAVAPAPVEEPRPGLATTYAVTVDGAPVKRGHGMTTVNDPAQIVLGGYCHVDVRPHTILRIEGEPYRESIFVDRGSVACRVDRNVGTFEVTSVAGNASVLGTKFDVRVSEAVGAWGTGGRSMFVAVASGAVSVASPTGTMLLTAGMAASVPDNYKARCAAEFVSAVGVNTHPYPNVYARYDEWSEKIGALGVGVIRDGAVRLSLTRAEDLYRRYGIRLIALTGRREAGPFRESRIDPGQIGQELADIKKLAPEATVALEGPNEYDLSHPKKEKDWIGRLRSYVKTLHDAARADPHFEDMPIVGPSICAAARYEAVGDLSEWVDHGCLHHYIAGRHPGTDGWGGNGYGSIKWSYEYCAYVQAPGKVVVVTEGANTTATDTQCAWTELTQGRYIPRYHLLHFNAGTRWICTYEFIDEGTDDGDREQKFGLLRNDLSEKPAYKALKSMLGVLRDPGPPHETRSMPYALSGTTKNVRRTLLQKRDGTFFLCLWLEVSCQNPDDPTKQIEVPIQPVLLTLPTGVTGAVVHTIDDEGELSSSPEVHATSLPLGLTDRVSIVEVRTERPKADEPDKAPARPARKTASAETLERWDAALKSRLTDALAGGARPVFFMSMVRAKATVRAISEDGAIALTSRGSEMSSAWERLKLDDKRSLALAVVRDGVIDDHCVAAFFAIASGDEEVAREQLARCGDLAEAIEAEFE